MGTMIRSVSYSCLGWIIFCCVITPATYGEYRDITDDTRLTFPSALFYQPDYRVQWWYLTGHLTDEHGREFGYEATFFSAGVQRREFRSRFGVNNIYFSHLAVTDIEGRRFLTSESADSGAYGFAGASADRLKVWVEKNVLEGDTKGMRLSASGGEVGLDLTLTPAKPAVLHGSDGVSRKSAEDPLIASYYFSFTRMRTEGSLRIGNGTYTVKGHSWFDREISTRRFTLKGWDWFSIRLEDDREIMLYLVRRPDGSIDPASGGTFIRKDGGSYHLAGPDFSVEALAHYQSKNTKARYPSRWKLTIPAEDLVLEVVPLLQDQEFVAPKSTGNYYWEGACAVTGSAKGRAYVELTGY